MGKIQISRENPSSSQPPILSFCAQSLQVVGEVNALEWEEYGKKFELGRALFFEKRVLTSWERKHPKTYAHSLMHSRFHLSSRFWRATRCFSSSILHSRGVLTQLNLPGFLSFTFLVVSSYCARPGNPFWRYGVNGLQIITIL